MLRQAAAMCCKTCGSHQKATATQNRLKLSGSRNLRQRTSNGAEHRRIAVLFCGFIRCVAHNPRGTDDQLAKNNRTQGHPCVAMDDDRLSGRSVSPGAEAETYYAIQQPSYLAAVALTPEGRILLVRQYRPAIERFSFEFPAGVIEENESDPANAMARELLEETGYTTESITLIGHTATCSSRISNCMYSFFIRARARVPGFVEEPGVSVSSVTPGELRDLVRSGEFSEQTHLGVLTLAMVRGLLIF
jgi:ADP-ribose diphosphatase